MQSNPKRAQRSPSMRVLKTSMARRRNIAPTELESMDHTMTRDTIHIGRNMTNMLPIHIGRNMTNMLRIHIGQEPKTKERKKMRKNHIGHIMRELHIGQNMTNMLPNRHIGQHWILERTWTWAPFDCRELPNR